MGHTQTHYLMPKSQVSYRNSIKILSLFFFWLGLLTSFWVDHWETQSLLSWIFINIKLYKRLQTGCDHSNDSTNCKSDAYAANWAFDWHTTLAASLKTELIVSVSWWVVLLYVPWKKNSKTKQYDNNYLSEPSAVLAAVTRKDNSIIYFVWWQGTTSWAHQVQPACTNLSQSSIYPALSITNVWCQTCYPSRSQSRGLYCLWHAKPVQYNRQPWPHWYCSQLKTTGPASRDRKCTAEASRWRDIKRSCRFITDITDWSA